MDIRRSANVEADAAGADKKTMGELLANGLADSKFLDETYTPPTVTKAREVAAQRLEGRRKLASEVTATVAARPRGNCRSAWAVWAERRIRVDHRQRGSRALRGPRTHRGSV
jgi:hypothetical protein